MFQSTTVIEDNKFVERYQQDNQESVVIREIQGEQLVVVRYKYTHIHT